MIELLDSLGEEKAIWVGHEADRVNFTSTKRNSTTKRKTTGTWTAFVLWLRTRLLRLGRQ